MSKADTRSVLFHMLSLGVLKFQVKKKNKAYNHPEGVAISLFNASIFYYIIWNNMYTHSDWKFGLTNSDNIS